MICPEGAVRLRPGSLVADSSLIPGLLAAPARGEAGAMDRLMPLVYDELRQIAHRHLTREQTGHTLDTTALVHEAFLKLVGAEQGDWRDRGHFFATASTAMRHILVDYARTRRAAKRGGGDVALQLDEAIYLTSEQADRLLELDEAMTRLATTQPRRAKVVECRFFGGLSLQETADAVGISVASVKREWVLARVWLNRTLTS
jgi:RNA polymerase sigma factor (TIGR02999 family)